MQTLTQHQRSYKMTYPIYEVVTTATGNVEIKRTEEDGTVSWIPEDPSNSDYEAYLASLNEVPA
jgi:hypothetical protein